MICTTGLIWFAKQRVVNLIKILVAAEEVFISKVPAGMIIKPNATALRKKMKHIFGDMKPALSLYHAKQHIVSTMKTNNVVQEL